MASVMELCDRGLLLKNGTVESIGDIKDIIPEYLNAFKAETTTNNLSEIKNRFGSGLLKFHYFEILDENNNAIDSVLSGQDIKLKFHCKCNSEEDLPIVHFSLKITEKNGNTLMHVSNSVVNGTEFSINKSQNDVYLTVCIKKNPFNSGTFPIHLFLSDMRNEIYDEIEFAGEINVEGGNFYNSGKLPKAEITPLLLDAEVKID